MTEARWAEIERQGGLINLSHRAKWRLTGADRVRYLNGQITNDVRKLPAAQAMRAFITDHKAHLLADLFVHNDEADALLVDAESCLRETLTARLERYIIADDVELVDVTDDFSLWHLFGPAAAAAAEVHGGVRASRVGQEGLDFWLPAGACGPATEAPVLDEDEAEALRILRHLPRHPAELGDSVFPAETGLEAETVSFSKGCYIGQEIVSRMKLTGKMPRVLMAWEALSGAPEVGQSLVPKEGEAEVGRITSMTAHPASGKALGLAYVKQSAALPDSLLLASGEELRIAAEIRLFPR